MKELLADNMALHSQLEDLPAQAAVGARPHRLREIDSPLSWVFCFLGYVAVRTKDSETRNMLSYARLIVREAQCHGGIGWLEYDKWFRQQQAALTTQHPWNELNASLHAATWLQSFDCLLAGDGVGASKSATDDDEEVAVSLSLSLQTTSATHVPSLWGQQALQTLQRAGSC